MEHIDKYGTIFKLYNEKTTQSGYNKVKEWTYEKEIKAVFTTLKGYEVENLQKMSIHSTHAIYSVDLTGIDVGKKITQGSNNYYIKYIQEYIGNYPARLQHGKIFLEFVENERL